VSLSKIAVRAANISCCVIAADYDDLGTVVRRGSVIDFQS